jgi:hypothetical protein
MGERWIRDSSSIAMPCSRKASIARGTRCPEDDGSNDQVESACAITLVFEAAVAQVALAVEEDGTGERVPGFALVETNLNTPTQPQGLSSTPA